MIARFFLLKFSLLNSGIYVVYVSGTCIHLAYIDNSIYHEGNISKMPDFDVFSLLEFRKRKSRSHCKRQKENGKRKICAAQKSNTSLNDLSTKLREHGRHVMLSFFSSLPIPVLCILDIEATMFYERHHQMYQHVLHPLIYSEINHKRHFIKTPFINKVMTL